MNSIAPERDRFCWREASTAEVRDRREREKDDL